MIPHQLATKIRNLRDRAPTTASLERVLMGRGIWSKTRATYTTQRDHSLGWLSEYYGPGYYGRRNRNRSAEHVYSHVVCPPMALWLGEASGIPKAKVENYSQVPSDAQLAE